MASIGNIQQWEEFWTGIEGPTVDVGVGTVPYQLYATPGYQLKKKKSILIGSVARIVYAGFEHDPAPTILTFEYEPRYQTVMAFNLHYAPPRLRLALLEFVLKVNRLRIKQRKPLIVDYKMLKRAFPWVANLVRRYKLALIGVKENVPMIGWKSVSEEASRFKGTYKGNGVRQR